MKFVRTFSAVALAAAVAVGCSDSTDPADVTIEDLVGTWVASSFTYTADANPAQTFDLVANGGGFTLTVQADGSVTGTQSILGMTDTFNADMTVANGVLTVTTTDVPPEVLTFTFTLDGNTITMTDTSAEFDFTLMGNPEVAANLVIVATR